MTNNQCKYKNVLLNSNKSTNDLINESYVSFCSYMKKELYFRGKKVLFKTEKDLHTMKELGFEHIISMKNKFNMRLYESNRMIYVPLIEKILSDCSTKTCTNIAVYKDNKDICIWCKENKFLMVLSPRTNGYLLNTAYPVIYENKIREIEKKANENGL